MKTWLATQRFDDGEELHVGVRAWLKSQAATFYDDGINKLLYRCGEVRFCLVILTSRFEATRCYFGTDQVILNRGQMTRTTPQLAPPSPGSRTTPAGGRLTPYV
ncbi:hypothetical protein AVEN_53130-1 [Araneus ventricosus]|uniref:Uncharacterized protein n=1 Tax=Araneus ventricosus TaxID=182803 RepID=A0A4Y2J6B6_ARAVE|nr:hypothetical protein AVEN_53130-1 [Araneus ventricosus]